MDKKRYLEIAPLYYALAMMTALTKKGQGRALSLAGMREVYSYTDEDDPTERHDMLHYYPLMDRALAFLQEHNLVEVIEDDFGDALYVSKPPLWGGDRPDILDDPDLPFYKFSKATDSDAWLESALLGVNRTFGELGISSEDFDNPDREWAPLPLDRANDPTLQKAIESLDATLKQVREDNGYAAAVPEERNFVVESLSTATRVLKTEATTSAPFIRRYVLEPLVLVARRFGKAALGVLTEAAKEAVKEYLRRHGVEWLADLFG